MYFSFRFYSKAPFKKQHFRLGWRRCPVRWSSFWVAAPPKSFWASLARAAAHRRRPKGGEKEFALIGQVFRRKRRRRVSRGELLLLNRSVLGPLLPTPSSSRTPF